MCLCFLFYVLTLYCWELSSSSLAVSSILTGKEESMTRRILYKKNYYQDWRSEIETDYLQQVCINWFILIIIIIHTIICKLICLNLWPKKLFYILGIFISSSFISKFLAPPHKLDKIKVFSNFINFEKEEKISSFHIKSTFSTDTSDLVSPGNSFSSEGTLL